jgi:DNA-binding HxlR family transcriptional regulator
VRGYQQYCPIARTLDLLGDRWTLLVVRELLRGRRRFKDIESGLPGIPPNLLSDRLKALEQARIVTREYFRELPPRVEYSLTDRGRSLEVVLESIAGWGMEHLMDQEFPCDRVAPDLLFFHLPRFFCPDKAGDVSATLEVTLEGEGGGTWWVSVERGACAVFDEAPEQPATASIACDVQTVAEVLAGHRDPARLVSAPGVRLGGDADLARRFMSFFCRESAAASL